VLNKRQKIQKELDKPEMILTFKLLGVLLAAFVLFMVVSIAFLLKLIIKTAPQDVQERLKDRPDPPLWKTILGIVLAAVCLMAIAAVFICAGKDAVRSGMTFGQIFVRFLILFEGYKLFDMIFLDWLMLTKLNVYQRFFPEVIGCESMEKFGFNLKSQVAKIVIFAILALVVAFILSRI